MRPPRGADGVLAEGRRRAPRAPARCRRRLKSERRCPDRRHDARWRRGEAGDPWRGRGERMTAVLEGNLDYILFVYGLGFVLLAITLLGLRTRVASPLPWKWLGISAVFLGLSAWADMLTLAVGPRAGMDAGRGPAGARELEEEAAPRDKEGDAHGVHARAMADCESEHVG